MTTQPIALLTFAPNDLKNVLKESKYLTEIFAESTQIQSKIVPSLNETNLLNAVTQCGNQLRLLHFGGHANTEGLALEDLVQLDAVRFTEILKNQNAPLDLVFLNACKTYGHAVPLLGSGTKAVLITNANIDDRDAMRLSAKFYELFVLKNCTLSKAFKGSEAAYGKGAQSYVHTLYPWQLDGEPFQGNWLLLVNKHYAHVADWTLADFLAPKTVSAPPIPKALTLPPFPLELFLGREEDLKTIEKQLFSGENLLLLVNGQGGVGKTSVAAKYFATRGHLYQHTAWVSVPSSSIGSGIASGMLRELSEPLGLQFDPQAKESERFQILLNALGQLEKPSLLVLDNANDWQDLEAHYRRLLRCSNFHILLTTRITELGQVATHRLEGLPLDLSLRLFQRCYPKFNEAELPLFHQIYEAVGGNTLVVEVMAKNLKAFHGLRQQYSLGKLLRDLQSKGVLKLSKSESVSVSYQATEKLRKETPEAIIEAMYDLSGLGALELRVMSVLSVLPSDWIGFERLVSLWTDGEEAVLEQTLLKLGQLGWLELQGETIKCHPVIQAIVQKKHPNLRKDCDTLINSLVKKLELDTLHEENYKNSEVFARYATAVVAIFPEPNPNIAMLQERIGTFHTEVGALDTALKFYEAYLKLCEELYASFPLNVNFKNGLAISYSNLGETHMSLGQLKTALKFYEDFSHLMKELHTSFPSNVGFKNGLAISYSKLGETHGALGQLEIALKFYQGFRQFMEELYESSLSNVDFKNGLAIAYSKLGQTHTSLGQLPTALTFYEDFSHLMEELYVSFPSNVNLKNGLAISYSKLGETHAELGQLPTALKFYEDFNRLFDELCASFPSNVDFKNGLAVSYLKLGDTHAELGQLPIALKFYEEQRKLGEELYTSFPLNMDFKNRMATSYERIGFIYFSLGNWVQTLKFQEKRYQLSKELSELDPSNVNFKQSLAASYQFLGLSHATSGNLDEALKFYEDFNQLTKELCNTDPSNVIFKNSLALSYQFLGTIHTSLGNLDKALKFHETFNQLMKELCNIYPSNVIFKNALAFSYQYLGITHNLLENLDKALSFHKNFNQLMKELCNIDPSNVDFKNALAVSYRLIGDIYAQFNKLELALQYSSEGHKLNQELYETFPSNTALVLGYALSSRQMGTIKIKLQNTAAALPYLEIAYQLLVLLCETANTPLHYQQLKETELLLQATKPGCMAFFMKPLMWFLKRPFMQKTVKKMREQAQKQLNEDYRNEQK